MLSNRARNAMFGLGIMIIFMSPSISNTIAETSTIQINPAQLFLSPFDSQLTGIDIRDYQSGALLQTITNTSMYHDPASKYPDVDAWVSKPFMVDPSGMMALTPEQYKIQFMSPEYQLDFAYENGTHDFLRVVNIAVDVVVRSYSNAGIPVYNTYYESPLTGTSWLYYTNVFCKYKDKEIATGIITEYPDGVILASLDTSWAPWQVAWELGSTSATKAKIDFSLENYRDPNYENRLRTNYGNTKVKVIPKFKFNALENFIRYDYNRVIDNKVFNIHTETTKMGILDAMPVEFFNKFGKVSNYAAPQQLQVNMATDNKEETEKKTDNTRISDLDRQYSSVNERYASFKYISESIEQDITGEIRPPNKIEKDIYYPSSVNINEFDALPSNVNVSYEVVMQPFTTVKKATYRVEYSGYAFNSNWWAAYEKWWDGQYDVTFPYNLKSENVYDMYRIKFVVAILSKNSIDYIPASGSPINVENIYDYGISNIGVLNPRIADIEGSTLSINRPWYFELQKWWNGNQTAIYTIIFAVIGGMIILVVLITVIRKQSGSRSKRR